MKAIRFVRIGILLPLTLLVAACASDDGPVVALPDAARDPFVIQGVAVRGARPEFEQKLRQELARLPTNPAAAGRPVIMEMEVLSDERTDGFTTLMIGGDSSNDTRVILRDAQTQQVVFDQTMTESTGWEPGGVFAMLAVIGTDEDATIGEYITDFVEEELLQNGVQVASLHNANDTAGVISGFASTTPATAVAAAPVTRAAPLAATPTTGAAYLGSVADRAQAESFMTWLQGVSPEAARATPVIDSRSATEHHLYATQITDADAARICSSVTQWNLYCTPARQ